MAQIHAGKYHVNKPQGHQRPISAKL